VSSSGILFEKQLHQALSVARSGNVAIVIVPKEWSIWLRRGVLNALVYALTPNDHNAKADYDAQQMVYTGTRGSVRIFPSNHATFDPKKKRLTDYPAGIPTFIHPDVESV
jgi:hypothetical protein